MLHGRVVDTWFGASGTRGNVHGCAPDLVRGLVRLEVRGRKFVWWIRVCPGFGSTKYEKLTAQVVLSRGLSQAKEVHLFSLY